MLGSLLGEHATEPTYYYHQRAALVLMNSQNHHHLHRTPSPPTETPALTDQVQVGSLNPWALLPKTVDESCQPLVTYLLGWVGLCDDAHLLTESPLWMATGGTGC